MRVYLNTMFHKPRRNIVQVLVKKELGYYINNPFGYIAICLFGIFANFIFIKDLFLINDGSMKPFFEMLVWLLLIFVPVVGMRLFADEKKLKTMELLLSLPVTISEIVSAKFLALSIFCFATLSVTFLIPIVLLFISHPHIPTIIVSYSGVIMLIGLFSSITLFFSSRTSSQIIALLSSLLTIFILLVMDSGFFTSLVPTFIKNIFVFISPLNYLEAFYKGILDLRSVIFFLSTTFLFLFFTYVSVKNQHHS